MAVRDVVLEAIRAKQGEWVSGEALSKVLGVTRTTVWKRIKALQSQGYAIETSSRKGYRLVSLPDILSREEVVPGLRTKVFGQKDYFYLQEVDSTNNYAKMLAADGYPEGTAVVAEQQTAGRGRRGRSWHSRPGEGIYLSLILRPVLPLNEISRVTLAAAVAVVEVLKREARLASGIKWPNDILVNGKKITGILTEAVTDIDGVEYIIVGIGINVNNSAADFPQEFRDTATSVREEVKQKVSRIKLLQGLLEYWESNYQQILNGEFNIILEKVRSLSLAIGRDVLIDSVNGAVAGRAIDIDNHGFLMVRDAHGNIHHVMSGEILMKETSQN